jgi:hypothetical protein
MAPLGEARRLEQKGAAVYVMDLIRLGTQQDARYIVKHVAFYHVALQYIDRTSRYRQIPTQMIVGVDTLFGFLIHWLRALMPDFGRCMYKQNGLMLQFLKESRSPSPPRASSQRILDESSTHPRVRWSRSDKAGA